MVCRIKDFFYFPIAAYFRFFARIRLARWHPRVVVVTGSNGKTTTFTLIEMQLGERAHYSRHANSSFGIPFDILGLTRKSYAPIEWLWFFLLAPIYAWKGPYPENIYVVEADSDRPGEGEFLSALLEPEVVVWLSSARTHSMNFERSARARGVSVDRLIAHEFGYFAERAQRLVIVNADEPLIGDEVPRADAKVRALRKTDENVRWDITISGTEFGIGGTRYRVPYLLPEETWASIAASAEVATYFGVTPTTELWKAALPPGRSSLLKGIKTTVLIDSTYNANFSSTRAILKMVEKFPAKELWLVLGDFVEQGSQEKEEHEKLAHLLNGMDVRRILFVGPRVTRYTLPLVVNKEVIPLEKPADALEYLRTNLRGGETIVFKGARFLEGVVEHLLADPSDAAKLCRREEIWRKRRAQWGL